MKKTHWIVIGVIAFCFLSVLAGLTLTGKNSSLAKKQSIAIVNLEGEIVGGSGGNSLLGQAPGSDNLLSQLVAIRKDPEVKGVLLRINSPGGSSAASQEIYGEIQKIRKAGKVVVVSMGDVCASGGYWVATAADKIVANPSTMTGSIGVIMPVQNVEGLMKKLGISSDSIKSGKYKDIGSTTRAMTPEERKLLQNMVDDVYQQFVDVVAQGRKLPREKVLAIADGRIFTGKQAQQLGLVDQLGNYYDALDLVTKMTKIKGEPQIKQYERKTPLDYLMNEGE